MGHDCTEALEELYSFLDGECPPEVKAQIQAHLDDCPPCFETYDFEAEIKAFVRSRCQERAPEDLRSRVADAIGDATGDVMRPDSSS